MRSSLAGVRRRVEALDRGFRAACDGNHQVVRFDDLAEGEPLPEWADARSSRACVCGQPLAFHRVVFRLIAAGTSQPMARGV